MRDKFILLNQLANQKGKIIGVNTNAIAIANNCNGTPTFTKSIKVYFPGVKISVFTGDAIGVANAVEAASATIIIYGSGFNPILCAAVNAIGATNTVVAVLDIN